MGVFLFLLGLVTAYQLLRRVPVNNLTNDLSSDQLSMKQVLVPTPTPIDKAADTQIPSNGQFKVQGQITPTAAKSTVKSQVYTVKSGDSLWKIAKEVSGDPYLWTTIYTQNKQAIGKNPGLIYPGMQLTVPVVTSTQ